MKSESRVIVTFPEADSLEPLVGKFVERLNTEDKGLVLKVRQDDGTENWHPDDWVKPLLKAVS